ncbi:MAG: toll/interleukin-1 receptor domain-containing protein [Clostridia bacterium]|nr:toll/interleukin-1 receptor domain-containing protein [Clostridia bacterium]
MAKYNFFISYCHKDGTAYAREIKSRLTERGYSVRMDDELTVGFDFASSIAEAIQNSDCFLPIITDAYSESRAALNELELALRTAKGRGQRIIPLYMTDGYSPPVSFSMQDLITFNVSSADGITRAVDSIDSTYGHDLKSKVLYEKLSEYKSIQNENKVAATVCELILLTVQKWESSHRLNYGEMKDIIRELCRLYNELDCYSAGYDAESKQTARVILDTISKVPPLTYSKPDKTQSKNIFQRDVYFCAAALRLIYLERTIRTECVDVITSGDVPNPCPIDTYISRQEPFLEAYRAFTEDGSYDRRFTEEDTDFIRETESFICKNEAVSAKASHSVKDKLDDVPDENDEILRSVAKFMQEGNRLFDALEKRGIAGDFLSCLLTSYERLKNYCEVVGAKGVAADCVDRIVEIRRAIERAEGGDAPNEKAENGIKSLLGFTLRGSGNYDVFISFKSEDSDLAERIYNFCQKNLKVPFWSKRTLPQLSKSEYEDAIYDALRKSRHFIVVLSNIEYLSANWIKREMAAFDRAITEGRKKDANFVFVVTDDVYRQIISSNKMCLDERYCGYQIIKMSEYEETLMSYII